MRLTRIVAALVALDPRRHDVAGPDGPGGRCRQAQARLQATGKEIGNTDKFLAYGKVSTFPSGKIKILRKVGTGGYKAYKKVKTKANGKFRTRITQVGNKRTCFKVVVPETATYKQTQAGIGCIFSA